MPLPLLAAPVTYALATTATAVASSTPTAATLGLGAAAVGGGGWFTWWWFGSKSATQTEEHQRSLNTQNQQVLERIADANNQVIAVREAAEAIVDEVAELKEVVGASATALQGASKNLDSTSRVLLDAGQVLQKSSDAAAALTPDLQAFLERMQQENARTAARLDEMIILLNEKDAEMERARSDIQTLTRTLGEQAEVITTLGDTVQILTDKNQEQAQRIAKQSEQVSQYRSAAEAAYKNCQFFKQMAIDARRGTAGEAPRPEVAVLSS